MAKYYGEKKSKGFAGLPSEKVMKPYPKGFSGAPEYYQDSREALDSQAAHAHSKIMKKSKNR